MPMMEDSEPSPGYLRDWSSHEAMRSLAEQVSLWRVIAALSGTALVLGMIAVALWSNVCRIC